MNFKYLCPYIERTLSGGYYCQYKEESELAQLETICRNEPYNFPIPSCPSDILRENGSGVCYIITNNPYTFD